MKLFLKTFGTLLVLLLIVGVGTYLWASSKTTSTLSRTFQAHTVDFPIPFPLDSAEVASLKITSDSAAALAQARAVERGKHLVESRYACIECHGADFSGGTMVDAPILGRLLGPNITAGEGGKTANYTAADWDRIVRHGIRPDGTPAVMPSEDFKQMSDQELSDIVSYIRSRPAVDNEIPPVSFGPLGKILIATGKFPLSADLATSHDSPHERFAPAATVSVEFGKHLAGVCTGCHQPDFGGGKITGGDPSWPPATNLTSHETALANWSFTDFVTAMHEGKRPDGSLLKAPMTLILPYARRMTNVELEALWTYIRSLPAVSRS